jgi:hypothetical protein
MCSQRSGFWYLLSMFHLDAFFFGLLFPCFPSFQSQLVIFYSTLMGVFWRLLHPNSLECHKTPIIYHWVVLSISNGGIRLISSKIITPTTYMGSWVLATPIITSKFLLDFCMFLLKAKGVSNLGLLIFQVHLKSTRNCFPLKVVICVPFFFINWLKMVNIALKRVF